MQALHLNEAADGTGSRHPHFFVLVTCGVQKLKGNFGYERQILFTSSAENGVYSPFRRSRADTAAEINFAWLRVDITMKAGMRLAAAARTEASASSSALDIAVPAA